MPPIVLPRSTRLYEDLVALLSGLVFMALGWAVGYPLAPRPWDLVIGVGSTVLAVAATTSDLVLNRRQQRFFTLRVVERTLEFHRGRYLTTDAVIAPGSVLSIDVEAGPVMRKLGLARLKLHGIAHFPEIPPLAEADARAVQSMMTGAPRPGLVQGPS